MSTATRLLALGAWACRHRDNERGRKMISFPLLLYISRGSVHDVASAYDDLETFVAGEDRSLWILSIEPLLRSLVRGQIGELSLSHPGS